MKQPSGRRRILATIVEGKLVTTGDEAPWKSPCVVRDYDGKIRLYPPSQSQIWDDGVEFPDVDTAIAVMAITEGK